ncbi:hypothetical protein LPJ70_007402, partial [Coemansia sp. RSA 2708]
GQPPHTRVRAAGGRRVQRQHSALAVQPRLGHERAPQHVFRDAGRRKAPRPGIRCRDCRDGARVLVLPVDR